MNLSFPQLLAGSIGALLIYCAVVNKTPVQVMKDALGQQAAAAQPQPYSRPAGTPSGDARSNPYATGGPGKQAI